MKAGKYALDTNIVVALFNQDENVKATLAEAESVSIPLIVLGELYYGAYHSAKVTENIQTIEQFLISRAILELDPYTTNIYGQLKQYLRTIGKPIPDNDLWIAAQCKQHGLTLVTRDAHFSQLPDLACENW